MKGEEITGTYADSCCKIAIILIDLIVSGVGIPTGVPSVIA
jgi:hypothetical protein